MQLTPEELQLSPDHLFYRLLKSGRVDFVSLAQAYIEHLESVKQKDRELICELAVLVECYKNPKLWQGTKKELQEKYKAARNQAGVYPEV